MGRDFAAEANVFKAFCDEKRLRILDLLRDGEKCACVLNDEMGMPQSTLSYHMKILCDSGVVEGRQAGKWTHYSISRQGMDSAAGMLRGFTFHRSRQQKKQDCCASL